MKNDDDFFSTGTECRPASKYRRENVLLRRDRISYRARSCPPLGPALAVPRQCCSLWKLESMYNAHAELNPQHILKAFAKTPSVTIKINRRTFSTCGDLSLSGAETYTCLGVVVVCVCVHRCSCFYSQQPPQTQPTLCLSVSQSVSLAC